MIRTACTAAVFTLIAACGGTAQDAPPASDTALSIQAEPLVLFPDDPGRMRVGDLRYTGGLVLTSDHEWFGGWSAMLLDPQSDALDLVLLSDRGTLAYGQVRLGEAGQPLALSLDRMEPLSDLDGSPLEGAAADAEGLAIYSDTQLAISFERDHRIWVYEHSSPLQAQALVLPPRTEGVGNNAGLEGLAIDDTSIWASVEYPIRGEDTHTLWRYDRADLTVAPSEYQLALDTEFGITSLDGDGAGGLYILQRQYQRGVGNTLKILHLTAEQITSSDESALEPNLLAELTPDMSVDNFEGLSVTRINGQDRFFLISDDNFNDNQRTLLISFALDPRP